MNKSPLGLFFPLWKIITSCCFSLTCQCMMGDENAIGLVVCIHTHTLAHIQTNEKEGCFYWSNCTLALK